MISTLCEKQSENNKSRYERHIIALGEKSSTYYVATSLNDFGIQPLFIAKASHVLEHKSFRQLIENRGLLATRLSIHRWTYHGQYLHKRLAFSRPLTVLRSLVHESVRLLASSVISESKDSCRLHVTLWSFFLRLCKRTTIIGAGNMVQIESPECLAFTSVLD